MDEQSADEDRVGARPEIPAGPTSENTGPEPSDSDVFVPLAFANLLRDGGTLSQGDALVLIIKTQPPLDSH